MTEQKQAPERIWASTGLYYDYSQDWTEGEWDDHDGGGVEYIRKDLHDAAIKQRDELAAEVDRLERDKLRLLYRVKKAEAERDEALAASAAREIAMRDRAAEPLIDVAASLSAAISLLERGGKEAAASDKMFAQMITDYKASLERARTHLNDPLSPDGQQALDDVRAEEWDFGYQACDRDNHSDTITPNPHRTQPSRSSDAGESEDRG